MNTEQITLKAGEYIQMAPLYPQEPLKSENYTIQRFSLNEQQVRRIEIMTLRAPYFVRNTPPESDVEYVRLVTKDGDIMMSDTPMEKVTNQDVVFYSNGDVLIFGLGIGLIVLPILAKTNVKSILIVELDQGLIDIVSPILKQLDSENKITITQGDAFSYHDQLEKGSMFDTIYFDIWVDINSENYAEQKLLHRRYNKFLNKSNPLHFMDSWLKSYYRDQKRKGKF